jgi:hypothetical protein
MSLFGALYGNDILPFIHRSARRYMPGGLSGKKRERISDSKSGRMNI